MIEWVGVIINLLFSNYKSGNQILLLIFLSTFTAIISGLI